MKKLTMILSLLLAFIVGSKTYAQEGLSFGIKAGANLSNMYGSDYFDYLNFKSKFGFQIGATVEYGFTENLFLGSGLEFTTKGTRRKIKDMLITTIDGELAGKATDKITWNPMYLQVPLHIGYKFRITDNIKLTAEVGPYVAFGIAGKLKSSLKGAGEFDNDESLEIFGKKKDRIAKRLDFGVGGALGIEFGLIVVKVGYDLGLIDISVWDENDNKMKNGNLYFTIGYKF